VVSAPRGIPIIIRRLQARERGAAGFRDCSLIARPQRNAEVVGDSRRDVDRPLLADSVEKVGLGFHERKVRV